MLLFWRKYMKYGEKADYGSRVSDVFVENDAPRDPDEFIMLLDRLSFLSRGVISVVAII
jgi:hypothetical protein